MAQNPYVNKVIYGNQTVMDISGDTVTPADVASGKTFHDASGEAQTGSYVAPVIQNLYPSNSSHPQLVLENNYKIKSSGYAIESFNDKPAQISFYPEQVNNGEWYYFHSDGMGNPYTGWLVTNLGDKTPSDSNPPLLYKNRVYRPSENGYLFASNVFYGPKYTKKGTLPDFTAINTEQTIDTGLSSITYFYIEAKVVGANLTNIRHRTWLDTTQTANKQIGTQNNITNTTTSAANSGTDANGVITGNSIYIKVSGISGGVVTIKTGNNVSYLHKDIVWYAG